MTYKSIVVTHRGGPAGLQIVDNDLRDPQPGEVRVRVLASPVCADDVAVRVGNRPVLPKLPFVPGYSIIGIVDAVGEGVGAVAVGQRVAALTRFGGHAEVVYQPEKNLAPVPGFLNPAQASVLVLNYLVAYQCLHRVAKVRAGNVALLIGASGGVGTAIAQLGKLAGLKLYGLASPAKHAALAKLGVTPVDYHANFVAALKRAERYGFHSVYNGMDDAYFGPTIPLLRRRGVLVQYGLPQSAWGRVRLVTRVLLNNLIPGAKKIERYDSHRLGLDKAKDDWAALFKLLETRYIQPVIAQTFPLPEAAKAYALLESGRVTGSVVLVTGQTHAHPRGEPKNE